MKSHVIRVQNASKLGEKAYIARQSFRQITGSPIVHVYTILFARARRRTSAVAVRVRTAHYIFTHSELSIPMFYAAAEQEYSRTRHALAGLRKRGVSF